MMGRVMTAAERQLVRELAELLRVFAIRAERERTHAKDPQIDAILTRADAALWQASTRLDPL